MKHVKPTLVMMDKLFDLRRELTLMHSVLNSVHLFIVKDRTLCPCLPLMLLTQFPSAWIVLLYHKTAQQVLELLNQPACFTVSGHRFYSSTINLSAIIKTFRSIPECQYGRKAQSVNQLGK